MKFVAVAAVAFAALAHAQSRSDIPSCALPCLDDSVKKNTKCSTDDFTCICTNFDAIQGDATGCVLKACGADVALNKVLPATQKLCEDVKNGGGKSSSAPASSAPVTSAPATSAPAPSAPASSAPVSSASAPASSPAATKTATTECQTTLVPTASTSSNGTAPTTSAVITAGAAGFAPVGGLALLALGALAL